MKQENHWIATSRRTVHLFYFLKNVFIFKFHDIKNNAKNNMMGNN